MHRRALLRSLVAVPITVGILGFPALVEASEDPQTLIPLSELLRPVRTHLRPVRTHLREHGSKELFEEHELRSYVEMSINLVAAHYERADGRVIAELREDQIEVLFDGEVLSAWKRAVQWGVLVHALFVLSINWDLLTGLPKLQLPPEEKWKALKIRAEAQMDEAIERYTDAIERHYEVEIG